jgi:ElaB/YqjD/DUF883 family membrane-anchored ribosome-binding protein
MAERSEQLRRETEQTRARVAETLEELRARITPGQIVDQLVDYAGDSGAGEFFRNLGRQAVNNPIPVTLMGAGLAWLMFAGKSSGSPMAGRGLMSEAADTLGRWGSAAGDASGELKDKTAELAAKSAETMRSTAGSLAEKSKSLGAAMSETAREATSGWRGTATRASDEAAATFRDTTSGISAVADEVGSGAVALSDSAHSSYDAMSDKAASAYEDASEAAARAAAVARERAEAMTQSAADASRSFMEFCKEQPLVLAGIGLALGAVFGAALPGTRTENELMGETSDQLKERAQALAAEQYEKAKTVAEHAYEEGKKEVVKEAEKEGMAGTSELAQAPQESVPTAPALPEEGATAEGEGAPEPWHGQR